MKLIFLGASAAFCVKKGHFESNMLLKNEAGETLLIDCGTDIRHSLYAQGYSHQDIHAVYLSHLHSDHSGGLEWLGFCKRFMDNQRPNLYIHKDLSKLLWTHVLQGGMSSLEDEEANLSSYFEPQRLKNNSFVWNNYTFELIKTKHYMSNDKLMPSYGLFIYNNSHKIFLTTDTRFTPTEFESFYQQADIIFHDCETSNRISGQHARYQELITLPLDIKQKIWLYDYGEEDLPDAKKDGFLGFVTTGQQFNF